MIKLFKLIGFFYLIGLTFPLNTFAYVDPNTGGFFFTTVLPFVYGLLAGIVIFWKRIVNFIKGIFGRKDREEGH